jgi:hypothetical protein
MLLQRPGNPAVRRSTCATDGFVEALAIGFGVITVKDAHVLETWFGHWPDFRGARVSSIRLFAGRDRPAQLELDIEVVELFRDSRGVFRDRQRCVATFGFTDVLGARMEALWPFRADGALDALQFAEVTGGSEIPPDDSGGRRYRVRLVPTGGLTEAAFFCDEVAVLKAVSISWAI